VDPVQCRQCGAEWPREEVVDVAAGHGCPSCGGSALCARCGHPSKAHFGKYGSGRRGCRARDHDLQSLTAEACSCSGYAKRTGELAASEFAEPEPLPPLRIAEL
jgi:hypothetical protein